jgi:Cu(I)/Ag(I) efflux system membrane fusion protein
VRFTSLPGQVFDGTLARRGVAVDTIDRTLPIWVEINPPAGTVLQHNMLARVTLPVADAAPVLAVPLTAIARQGTRSYLFIREPNGSFRRQPVELGSRDDRHVAVTRGLKPGEVVAVTGVADLQTAFASIR